MYICNMTKVISLSDDAYGELKKLKEQDESFSDIVLRLSRIEKKKVALKLSGVWKNKADITSAFKEVSDERKKFKVKDRDLP